MPFQVGEYYTRAAICQELGGSLQAYLPYVGGTVVAGCFRGDLNPGAPNELLPGNTPHRVRWAEVFAGQTQYIPIYMKERNGRWKHAGEWRVIDKVTRAADITAAANRTNRDDISMILVLEKRE
jgi:hypothetical protein